MAYQEPFHRNSTRTPALILIVVFLLFAIFHTSVITFFSNLGHRSEIIMIFTPSPYITAAPATYYPTPEPTNLPSAQPTSIPRQSIPEGNLPTSGPADTFWIAAVLLIATIAIARIVSARRRLLKALHSK